MVNKLIITLEDFTDDERKFPEFIFNTKYIKEMDNINYENQRELKYTLFKLLDDMTKEKRIIGVKVKR
jgi:hypothetical protein